MCGRYTLTLKFFDLQHSLSLGLTGVPDQWIPRYNIAPTQPIAAILDGQQRKVEYLHWGLVPSWAKDISIGSKLINARSETITEKPSFKNAFQRRRCLILADGFYEWRRERQKGPARPYYFQLRDKAPFAFAGIYEVWKPKDGRELRSAAIITCDPNPLVGEIHDRMPVILDKQRMWDWLKNAPVMELTAMLAPYDAEKMTAIEVSPKVNSAQYESPDNVAPVGQNTLL